MTWEGPEESYNIFRWYKGAWGRYTQPDPIGVHSGDLNLYRYSLANPLRFADPLGLDVRLCCRPVNSRLLQQWDHCYVESNTNGRRETWGLYARNGMGEPRKNDPADRVPSRCSRWYTETCAGANCWTRSANNYPYEEYSEFSSNRSYFGLGSGNGRNSNTFAKCLWQKCGPRSNPLDINTVTLLAPGWDQPCPIF